MNIGFGSRFDHKSRIIYIKNLKLKIKKELIERENKRAKISQVKEQKQESTEVVEKPIIVVFKKKEQKKEEPIKKQEKEIKEEKPLLSIIEEQPKIIEQESKPKIITPKEIKKEEPKIEMPQIVKPNIEIEEPRKEISQVVKPKIEIKEEQPIIKQEVVDKNEEPKDKSKFGQLKYTSIGEKTLREERRDTNLVNHVNELIKESNKKIYDLTLRKEKIEDQIEKANTKEEQEKLQEELEKLKKELEDLMKKVDFYKFEFDQRYLDSIGLALESKKSDRTVIGNERYLGVYREIIEDIAKCENLIEAAQKDNVEKIEVYADRDKIYEEFKEIVKDHDQIDNNLKKIIANQKKEFEALCIKLKNSTTIEERTKIVRERIRINMNRNIAVILAARAVKAPMAPVLRALMLANAIEIAGQLIDPTTRVEKEFVTVTKDYSREIEDFNMDINESKKALTTSKEEINEILNRFKELESHPEYDRLLKDCNEIFRIIEENEFELDKLEDNLQKENRLAEAKLVLERNEYTDYN